MADGALPEIWALLGAKAGDNAQVLHLASQMPGRVVSKKLAFNSLNAAPNALLGASLISLKPESRAQLAGPWPALVIAAGKRSVPVARWIKRQSQGRTRLVQIGRPRAPLAAFDLVISTPQYGLPNEPNVLELPLPLVAQREVTPTETDRWQSAWQHLPRPLIAVAMGGAKHPLMMGQVELTELGARLNELMGDGSCLLLASPRTAPGAVAVIAAQLRGPHVAYESFDKSSNPYAAALAESDSIVVTGDSASMIADAVATGKPVKVFRLPVSSLRIAWSAKRGLGRQLSRYGLLQPPRAMHVLVERLVQQGVVGDVSGRASASVRADYQSAAVARASALLTGQ